MEDTTKIIASGWKYYFSVKLMNFNRGYPISNFSDASIYS